LIRGATTQPGDCRPYFEALSQSFVATFVENCPRSTDLETGFGGAPQAPFGAPCKLRLEPSPQIFNFQFPIGTQFLGPALICSLNFSPALPQPKARRQRFFMKPTFLATLLAVAMAGSLGRAQTSTNSEVQEICKEMEQLRREYEQRMQSLEERLKKLESPPAFATSAPPATVTPPPRL